ncbi:substrate-binding domain-containing protein [Aquimarina agarivorans]|uniref:substrate-binding domain-containing protein n=1 Tax=Aquimarina agarivorans TaxID=980584 RepID=UPI000248F861|nr:substrate-binding domain-containing protein [Aquimarina agarivorans]
MKKIKVGGVPEHFNLPWHLCIENGNFLKEQLEVSWQDFPGGTGAMCNALRKKEIDVAIILTEGFVKDRIAGNPSKIVQTYIETPLIWGIHVNAKSSYQNISDLQHTKAAISRYGSGSHLMAYVNAQQQHWKTDELAFQVVGNLNGAIESLDQGTSDYFMWEHFTTKPLVDNGTFRNISDCPTPWPCFVIVVREEVIEKQPDRIKKMLTVINTETINFKQKNGVAELLADRYNQKLDDITKWLNLTEWSQQQISSDTLTKVQNQLHELKIIDKIVDASVLSISQT